MAPLKKHRCLVGIQLIDSDTMTLPNFNFACILEHVTKQVKVFDFMTNYYLCKYLYVFLRKNGGDCTASRHPQTGQSAGIVHLTEFKLTF